MTGPLISPELIRRLSASRWMIPVLAEMAGQQGSRFSVLERALGASKSMLSATLASLERDGWVRKNAGHGHPLRPEYLLTAEGHSVAAWCVRIIDQRRALGIEHDALGRWSLPLIKEIGPDRARFTELQRRLAPISPRALSLELSSLCDVRLLNRCAPGPLYGLTDRGLELASALGES